MLQQTTSAREIAVWIFIIGIYIGAPFMIGDLPIPAFLSGVAGIFLLAVNFSYIRQPHVFLMLGLCALMLSGAVANIGDGADVARLKGAAQLLYSVAIAYGLFLELQNWEKARVASLFQAIALLILAGCLLESYTDFREWSDSFRAYVFADIGYYDSDSRDQLVFGKVRPKLFTAEPSYVAIFFLLSMTMWYTLAKEALVWKYFLMVMMGVFLIGSPIILLTILVPILNLLLLKKKSENQTKVGAHTGSGKKLLLYSSPLLLALPAIWLVVQMGLDTESRSKVSDSRLEQILEGKDDSVTGRLLAPPLIAYEVLCSSPWFGVGLEAKEPLNEIVLDVFERLGMQTNIVETSKLGGFVTNNFWLNWIYFGLFGGMMMVFWLYKLMKLIGVHHPLYCFVVIAMFMQTMGGYVTPRSWFVCFLIMLLGTMQNNPMASLRHRDM
jgi:hypothetical protein